MLEWRRPVRRTRGTEKGDTGITVTACSHPQFVFKSKVTHLKLVELDARHLCRKRPIEPASPVHVLAADTEVLDLDSAFVLMLLALQNGNGPSVRDLLLLEPSGAPLTLVLPKSTGRPISFIISRSASVIPSRVTGSSDGGGGALPPAAVAAEAFKSRLSPSSGLQLKARLSGRAGASRHIKETLLPGRFTSPAIRRPAPGSALPAPAATPPGPVLIPTALRSKSFTVAAAITAPARRSGPEA